MSGITLEKSAQSRGRAIGAVFGKTEVVKWHPVPVMSDLWIYFILLSGDYAKR